MEWVNVLVSNHLISIVVTVITGIVAYIFGGKAKQALDSKKSEAAIEGSITDNVVKNLDVYQRMFEDLELQISKLNERIAELEGLYKESLARECH